ncbi:carbohydrate ABC transporter permease [Paenibacillus pedocola]|uniref:carbohydrate ABC transporter permease n=1 Tax=Paenibacillus pedocola TaxID=3242193 RepID=UPI002877DF6A|nr:sugar ABC transporter permease [Paenibacillus typhae]
MDAQLKPKPGVTGTQAKQRISARAVLLSLGVLLANIVVNGLIFMFFRDSTLNPLLTAVLAVLWGVLGVYLIYYTLTWAVEQYPDHIRRKVLPYIFIGPAVIILGWLLILPALRTLYLSFFNASSEKFVGLSNYAAIFSDHLMATALRNNLLWVFVGTLACVCFGLLIAILADRSSYEKIAKSIIFMPMAISFVAAGVIWKFVYYYQPGDEQIGLLNAMVTYFGGEPQAWTSMLQPWNNFFLIIILIWMQTGFAMVIFSAAIKGVPDDILEAARVDGAGEVKIFFGIMIPFISSTILTVTTTIIVFTLKIFDVVMVMTGGQYDTEVVATQFYRQFFMYRNFGYGSTLAIVLLIAVLPVILINLRQFRKQGGF